MSKLLGSTVWFLVAALGTLAVATIALHRGEQINAMWLVVAAVCVYAIGYRFYSKFIAAKVLALDPIRATPAERLENGRDFVATNKWVVFGHHFAAIAGPGPLVGPVLAAQFGYLPGTLWVLAGAVLGGCVQDFVILLFSVRRDGKSLTEMAREEIGRVGGIVTYAAVITYRSDPARSCGVGGGQRAEIEPLGNVHHCHDDSHCAVDGHLSSSLATGEGAGILHPRLSAGDIGDIWRPVGGAQPVACARYLR